MLLRKETYFDKREQQKQKFKRQKQILKLRPYPWKDEMCEVGLYCAGFDTLFGSCVFAAVFSPIRMGKDITNHYGITDYVSQSESARFKKYKVIKRLNRIVLGFFVKSFTAQELSNELLIDDIGDRVTQKGIQQRLTNLAYKTFKKLIMTVQKHLSKINRIHVGSLHLFNDEDAIVQRFAKKFRKLQFDYD